MCHPMKSYIVDGVNMGLSKLVGRSCKLMVDEIRIKNEINKLEFQREAKFSL